MSTALPTPAWTSKTNAKVLLTFGSAAGVVCLTVCLVGWVFHKHHQFLEDHAAQLKLANELEPQFRLIADEAEYLQRLYKEGANTQEAERHLSESRTAFTQLVHQLTPFEVREQGLAVLAKIDFWITQNQQSRALATPGGSGEVERELRAFTQSLRVGQQKQFARYLEQSWTVQIALITMGVILLSLGCLFFGMLNKGIWKPLERLQRHVEEAAGLIPKPWLPATVPALSAQFEDVLAKLTEARKAEHIVNSITEGLIVVSPDGMIRSANKTILTMLGYSEEELIGRPFTDIYVKVQSLHVQGFFKRQDTYKEEELFKTRDGKVIPVRFSSSFLFDAEMEVQGFICIAKDITKEKRVEEELLKQADWFKITLASISDAVVTTDTEGRINFANQAALQLFGVVSEGCVGRRVYEVVQLVRTDTQQPAEVGQVSIEEDALCECKLVQPSGRELIVELAQAQIRSKEGAALGVVIVFRDMTAVHKSAQELSEAKERAEAALKVKTQFLANMSHEIRTPMNGVIGMTDLLMESGLRNDQREMAEVIRISGESLLSLLNDILDLSKIEAGKLVLEQIPFDPRSLVEDVIALLLPKAREKKLILDAQLAHDLPSQVLGDPGRMRQILLNLVSNAIKFTSTGKVHIFMESVERVGARCMIHCVVRDTGIGMESHQVANLFQAFTQADASTTRKFGGTGLGLAICKELTEAMGGIIGAKSWPGTGSEFSIRIPLLIQEDTEIAPALPPLRVLLVEDSEGSRKTLHSQLSHLGCSVESVGSHALRTQLQQAVDHNQPFQLLILDHQANQATLGHMLVQVRSDTSFMNLKIFLITSLSPETVPESCSRRLDCILSKPVRIHHLRSAIQRILFATEPQPQVASTPSRYRILVAEDNPLGQKVTMSLLEKGGYACDLAENGQEVLDALERTPYHLILMDCQMPVMDGYEATRRIRALEGPLRAIPIVAMTANAFKEDRDACLEAGMNEFLSKPVRKQKLFEVIQYFLRDEFGDTSLPRQPDSAT